METFQFHGKYSKHPVLGRFWNNALQKAKRLKEANENQASKAERDKEEKAFLTAISELAEETRKAGAKFPEALLAPLTQVDNLSALCPQDAVT